MTMACSGSRAIRLRVEAVAAAVLADGREVGRAHPLLLDAQHHHHVALAQLGVEVVAGPARPGLDRVRHEGGRCDQRHLGAERGEQQHVGAGHPGVEHVADDRHPEPVEALALPVGPLGPADCRMVNASSSACVGCSCVPSPALTTRATDPVRQPARRAGGGVPDHHGVRAHRLQGQRGVLERLALGDARPLGGEVDHVGGQPLGGRLEGSPGPRGVLVEEVHHGQAAQRRELPDGPALDAGQFLGRVKDQDGVVTAQVPRRDQVSVHWSPSPSSTESSPSISASWTRTFSRCAVGRFLPT